MSLNLTKVFTITINNILIFIVLLCLLLGIMELLLRYTTVLDQLNNPKPFYIPTYLDDENKKIWGTGYRDNKGFRLSYKTTSLVDDLKNDKGCKVVVLGDSFLMGDGVYPENTWTSKLSKLSSCKIYPFGKNGWSSLNYFQFYEEYLVNIDFDFLLIGIVSNDPHPKGTFLNYDGDSIPYIREYRSINEFYDFSQSSSFSDSLVLKYFDGLISNYLNTKTKSSGSMENLPIVTYGYYNWEKRLYDKDVFDFWKNILLTFQKYSKHKTAYLLTPTDNSVQQKIIFQQIEYFFKENNFIYLNTFDAIDKAFNYQLRPRTQWANLANGHPGQIQTDIYSKNALKLIESMSFKETVINK
jgi:hypothetical protein